MGREDADSVKGHFAGTKKEAAELTARNIRLAAAKALGTISEQLTLMATILEQACARHDKGRTALEAPLDGMLSKVAAIRGEELGGGRKLDLLVGIGSMYRSIGLLEEAFDCYLGALSASPGQLSPRERADLQLEAGHILCAMAEWSSAQSYAQAALESYTCCVTKAGVARALALLGRVHYQQGKYRPAKSCTDEGVATAREHGDQETLAELLNLLGLVYSLAREHGNSICSLQEALVCYQRTCHYRGVADVYHNMARVHVKSGRLADAAGCCDKALALCQKASYSSLMPFVLLTKAEIAWEQEDYLACVSFCRKGTEYLIGWGGPLALAKINRILGDLISRVMCWDYAESFYSHSRSLYSSYNVRAGEAWAYVASARGLEEEGRADESLGYLEKALRIYQELELDRDAQAVAARIARLKDAVLAS